MPIIPGEGKAWDALKVQNVAPASNAPMSYITWGTGAQAEAAVQTASPAFGSFTESTEARTLGTLSIPAAATDRCTGTITATAARTITQVARTNVATPGATGQTMGFYALFSGIPLQTADAIAFVLDQLFS